MDARDATIAQLRAEVANNRQTIALLRDQLNATQAALAAATGAQLAPAPPQLVVAAAKAYKLVHAEPDNVAHQIQVQRTGAIRRIVDKRRQLNILVRLEDMNGTAIDPNLLQPGGLHLRTLAPARRARRALRARAQLPTRRACAQVFRFTSRAQRMGRSASRTIRGSRGCRKCRSSRTGAASSSSRAPGTPTRRSPSWS
jgi:hypothetical protein